MAKSVENVLSEGFELVRQNYFEFLKLYVLFLAFFAVIAAVAVILMLALVLGEGAQINSIGAAGDLIAVVFIIVLVIAIIFLVEPLWIGSYYALALQYLNGGKMSVLDAVGKARSKYVQLLWTMALETLIFVAVDVVFFSPLIIPAENLFGLVGSSGSISTPAVTHALIILFGMGFVVMIMFLIVVLALAPLMYEAVPLVMLENVSGTKAIRESITIGKSNFRNLVWLFVLLGIIYGLITVGQGIVSLIFGLLGAIAGSILGLILSLAVGAFVTAWLYVLPIIFYKDFLGKKS